MKKKFIVSCFMLTTIAFFAFVLSIGGCGNENTNGQANISPVHIGTIDQYFLSGNQEDRELLGAFFSLLALETSDLGPFDLASTEIRSTSLRTTDLLSMEPANSQEQFAIIREIANTYIRQREFGRLITFLNIWIHRYPEDPFITFNLFMVAHSYLQMEAHPMAALYFDMIVKNYPDLVLQGNSIHLASLNQLIQLVDNPQKRVWYYEELISRFLDQIDPGPAYFMLAQAYEAIGEWGSAINAYTQYLPFAGSNVPGFPNADNHARNLVSLNNSARDWTFESLDTLVSSIQAALDAGSAARLLRYHARANFFTRTWEGDDDRSNQRTFDLHMADFMRGSRIRYANELDISSNANEAYLRTWGWPNYSSGWYFYFRRIYFPLDPDIHGNWEWAGIYYGERF